MAGHLPCGGVRWLLALVLLLAAPAQAETILCIGDSITQGDLHRVSYPNRLQVLLPNDHVVNEGMAGDVSSNLARFQRELGATHPHLVVIQYGTNDPSATPPLTTAQSFDNLRRMATLARQAGARVYLLTPPPAICKTLDCEHADPDRHALQATRDRGTEAIAQALLQARWPDGVRVLDLRSRWSGLPGGWAAYSDPAGLHPNPAGYGVMAGAVAEAITADRSRPAPAPSPSR